MATEVNSNRAWSIAGTVIIFNATAFYVLTPETLYSAGMTFLCSTAAGLIAEGCFRLSERLADDRTYQPKPGLDPKMDPLFYRSTNPLQIAYAQTEYGKRKAAELEQSALQRIKEKK